MEKEQLLTQFGLNDKEAKTYLAILELGTATIKPIALRAGLKRTSLYYFIDHLVALGLVSQTAIRGHMHYQALPPSRLVDLQKERLQTLEQALPEFMSLFNVAKDKPRVSYFEGPAQIKNIFWEEPKCDKEILGIWSGTEVDELIGRQELERIDKARRANGIHVRVIRFLEKDVPFAPFRDQPGSNRELRYAPPGTIFPIAFTLYDTGKVSFVSSKKEGFGILIESPELTIAMRVLFEALWTQSQPAKKLKT
jgi:sugar-specific transcriptional regulator TrmB